MWKSLRCVLNFPSFYILSKTLIILTGKQGLGLSPGTFTKKVALSRDRIRSQRRMFASTIQAKKYRKELKEQHATSSAVKEVQDGPTYETSVSPHQTAALPENLQYVLNDLASKKETKEKCKSFAHMIEYHFCVCVCFFTISIHIHRIWATKFMVSSSALLILEFNRLDTFCHLLSLLYGRFVYSPFMSNHSIWGSNSQAQDFY